MEWIAAITRSEDRHDTVQVALRTSFDLDLAILHDVAYLHANGAAAIAMRRMQHLAR